MPLVAEPWGAQIAMAHRRHVDVDEQAAATQRCLIVLNDIVSAAGIRRTPAEWDCKSKLLGAIPMWYKTFILLLSFRSPIILTWAGLAHVCVREQRGTGPARDCTMVDSQSQDYPGWTHILVHY